LLSPEILHGHRGYCHLHPHRCKFLVADIFTPESLNHLFPSDRWRRSLYVLCPSRPNFAAAHLISQTAVFVALENFLAILAYWTAMYIPPNLIEPLIIRRPASVLTYPVAIWNDRSKLPVGYAAIAGMICVSPHPDLDIQKLNSLRPSPSSLLACPKLGGSDGSPGRSQLEVGISVSKWALS
jgi:hypothetical protein